MILPPLQLKAAAADVVLQPLKPTVACVRHLHPYSSDCYLRDVARGNAQQSPCYAGTALTAGAAVCTAAVGRRSRLRQQAAASAGVATDVNEHDKSLQKGPVLKVPNHAQSNKKSRGDQLCGFQPKARYSWHVPQPAGPEIMLVGRSNAGKSTLINNVLELYGFSPWAPVSELGGRTRTLNWYPMNFRGPVGWAKIGQLTSLDEADRRALDPSGSEEAGRGFCLVDSFGLGEVDYTDLKAKRLQTWGPLLHGYLSERHCAVAVLHLVSSEFEGTLTNGDEQLLNIYTRAARAREAESLQPFLFGVVLTKTDLYPPEYLQKIEERMQNNLVRLGHSPDLVVMCSTRAEDGHGTDDFIATVESLSARGWESRDDWLKEANDKWPRKKPVNKQAGDRHQAKESFRKGRTHKRRGMVGMTPDLPPAV